MNTKDLYLISAFIFLIPVFLFTSGCTETDGSEDVDVYVAGNSTEVPSDEGDQTKNLNEENDTGDDTDQIYERYTTNLKRTEILEIDNGYSLRVLEIDKKEERIRVSLRKDGNEYSTRTMLTGRSYDVKDTGDVNVVYTVTVETILDNSFVVELTYTPKPDISLETGLYEGKGREIEVRISEDSITRIYQWDYDDTEFIIEYSYNKEAYDAYSERSRFRSYTHFVNDPYDDELISLVTTQLGNLATEAGYDRQEIPYITMAFVQSLPYVSDSASAGYDEYTRFPFETLYHGGGDCEDSSILLAALLYDMGYDVALIELPGHMAVGVKGGPGLEGSHYELSGTRYYYLETTNSGWEVGVIPDIYASEEANVEPVHKGYPELDIEFNGTATSSGYVSSVVLDIVVSNVGSEIAEDLLVYAALEATADGMVWDEVQTDTNTELGVDEIVKYTVSDLHVPAGKPYRVGIRAWGSNAEYGYVHSDWAVA